MSYRIINKHKVFIDEQDVRFFDSYSWYIIDKLGTPYVSSQEKGKTIYLARLILDAPDNMLVDHINGDTLDNRKNNLRLCNKRQNAQNSRPRKNTTSKYKGVCWDKFRNKWRVTIKYNEKQKYLGRFDDEIEAALYYNEYAELYFGEFARLNEVIL